MNAALQTTYNDLTGALAGIVKPAAKPAMRTRDYSTQSSAMKAAWASYRKWEADWIKDYNEPVGRFARHQFNMYLRHAYQLLRILAAAPVAISHEEASFIGSDCQYSDWRGL